MKAFAQSKTLLLDPTGIQTGDWNGLTTETISSPRQTEPIVSVNGLHKSYNGKPILTGVSFDVHAGEIFGFLGPNGAGKTTTLEIIEGLRRADSGQVKVFGLDHRRELDQIKQRLGVTLQHSEYWGQLRVGELIRLFQSFYHQPVGFDLLLDTFNIREYEKVYLRSLSGGQRQRVILCLAMVNNPDLILLDEPTVGLDPDSRRALWVIIRRLKAQGKTIILTTHYMEEAELLSDRVAIIHEGRIQCCDSPASLIAAIAAESTIEFRCSAPTELDSLHDKPWCSSLSVIGPTEAILYCREIHAALLYLVSWSEASGVKIDNLRIREPGLEDVFLSLTGRVVEVQSI